MEALFIGGQTESEGVSGAGVGVGWSDFERPRSAFLTPDYRGLPRPAGRPVGGSFKEHLSRSNSCHELLFKLKQTNKKQRVMVELCNVLTYVKKLQQSLQVVHNVTRARKFFELCSGLLLYAETSPGAGPFVQELPVRPAPGCGCCCDSFTFRSTQFVPSFLWPLFTYEVSMLSVDMCISACATL